MGQCKFCKKEIENAGENQTFHDECHETHKQRNRDYQRRYREKNKEKYNRIINKAYHKNPENFKKNSYKWRERNRDRYLNYLKRYFSTKTVFILPFEKSFLKVENGFRERKKLAQKNWQIKSREVVA